MVFKRFSSLILTLVFISLAIKDSLAFNQQAVEKILMAANHGFGVAEESRLIVGKESFNVVPSNAEDRIRKIKGRKMMQKRILGKEKVTQEASKSLVANHSLRNNCDHKEKEKVSIKSNLGDRSSHPVKIKKGNFMAFSADYHVAIPHPPKNN